MSNQILNILQIEKNQLVIRKQTLELTRESLTEPQKIELTSAILLIQEAINSIDLVIENKVCTDCGKLKCDCHETQQLGN